MKLEGKPAFRHSNIGLEPESKSLVFFDNDRISNGYKLQNQKMNEYENEVPAILENNEQGLDSSKYDMESAECVKSEYKVTDLVELVSHSSIDIESFMKFPNDIESVKRSPPSAISNHAKVRDSHMNSMDSYMDKTVTECEPHQEVCHKDSNYHVVKDICVDEGVLNKDTIVFVNTIDEKDHNFFTSESCENKEKQKYNNYINVLNLLAPTEESDMVSSNHDQPKDLMQKKVSSDVNKEIPSPEKMVLLQDLFAQDSVSADDKNEQNEPELHSQMEESKDTVEEATLASNSSALAEDESNNDTSENASFTHQLDPSAPADCGKEEIHQASCIKCEETQQISKPVEGKTDDQALTSHIRHNLGEASFSSIGPLSGRINYSGPVPYSGSISLRSDSSATSTRSFAFPIIQSEWNSSPVRMAKADRRLHRKRHCWMDGFLCCKF